MKIDNAKIKFRQLRFKVWRDFLTLDNIVLAIIVFLAIIWTWGSVSAMEKNYALEKKLEARKREQLVAEIEYETLKYEQKYLQSSEFKELAAREKLGLAAAGESVLILDEYPEEKTATTAQPAKSSNLTQWFNFLFGGNAKKVN